ncbi:hypothetical protein niasHT_023374 [Heterodera trifolii]|uniref:Serine/threonine-protein phosphatase n=1 Tax=Heterodera trifolii TaxID=157864 RepID=A0ABD2K3V8_9BILA
MQHQQHHQQETADGGEQQHGATSLRAVSSIAPTTSTPLTTKQLDTLIATTLNCPSPEQFVHDVNMTTIWQLCEDATNVLRDQASLVEAQPPMVMCGDIHGQFVDLKRIFNQMGFPPTTKYMFLGDIVDRGSQSVETIVLLLLYKVRYPTKFYVLRGNHECASINKIYGFFEEINNRYGPQYAQPVWERFNITFAWLPFVGLVGNSILCMHGGISPELTSIDQLRVLRRPHVDPPCPSLELDLLWADPATDVRGTQPNPRGVSILFGADVVTSVCAKLNIELIVRAHQCVPFGVSFFCDAYMLTLFSAPMYVTEKNIGAVLVIDAKLQLSFRFFKGSTKITPSIGPASRRECSQ